jgi:hypothetical protein
MRPFVPGTVAGASPFSASTIAAKLSVNVKHFVADFI